MEFFKGIIDKLIEKNIENKTIINSLRIKNILFSKNNIDINVENLNEYLNAKEFLIELTRYNFVLKENFYNLINEIPVNEIEDKIRNEYFIDFQDNELEKLLSDIGIEIIEEEKENILSESEKKLMGISDGLKNLEELLKDEKYWIEILKKITKKVPKKIEEIYDELIFFNKIEYKNKILFLLENNNNFEKIEETDHYILRNREKYSNVINEFKYEFNILLAKLDENEKKISEKEKEKQFYRDEKKLMLINEELKLLEELLKRDEYWIEILKKSIEETPKTIELIFNEMIFFNKPEYKNKIFSLLKNSDLFKKINYKNEYIIASNQKYLEFTNDFKHEFELFLARLNESEKKVFYNKIILEKTLENTGKIIGVTRERVRQIEKKIYKIIDISYFRKKFKPYLELIDEKIFNSEIILEKDEFLIRTKKYFIIEDEIIKIYNFLSQKKLYIILDNYVSKISENEIESIFKRIFYDEKILTINLLIEKLMFYKLEDTKFIEEYVKIRKNFEIYKNLIIYMEEQISSKYKLELIFKYEDRELKIKEIKDLYNEYYNKDCTEHNVATKLQMYNKTFTRVFVGTYSLTEWGINKHINSKDLILSYLKKMKRPCTYIEIWQGIEKDTRVNMQTIRVFTSDNNLIFAYSHGVWALKEWMYDDVISKEYKISENRINASENFVVRDSQKGSFKKNGKLLILYKINEKMMENSGKLYLNKNDFMDIKEEKISIYTDDKCFFYFFIDRLDIKGFKIVLDKKNLKLGDYFYLEYYGNGIMKIHTWEEFENNYIELYIQEEIKMEIREKKLLKEVGINTKKFNEVLEFGLENTYVESAWLLQIDYEIENEVFDKYEAYKILEEKGIIMK